LAFSATGVIEGLNKIVTSELISLSEQYLLDPIMYNGCTGGFAEHAFNVIIRQGGIYGEKDYPSPYTGDSRGIYTGVSILVLFFMKINAFKT